MFMFQVFATDEYRLILNALVDWHLQVPLMQPLRITGGAWSQQPAQLWMLLVANELASLVRNAPFQGVMSKALVFLHMSGIGCQLRENQKSDLLLWVGFESLLEEVALEKPFAEGLGRAAF